MTAPAILIMLAPVAAVWLVLMIGCLAVHIVEARRGHDH
jgi:hypothetical protein